MTIRELKLPLDSGMLKNAVLTLSVLDNGPRLKMLDIIHTSKCTTLSHIEQSMCSSQAQASTYLHSLLDIGIVTAHKQGKEEYYAINYEMLKCMKKLIKCLNHHLQKVPDS
jgi:predicted transcriptional regulator